MRRERPPKPKPASPPMRASAFYISATTSIPASPASTPADESDAAPLPSSFTPGIGVVVADAPVADAPVALAVKEPVLEA